MNSFNTLIINDAFFELFCVNFSSLETDNILDILTNCTFSIPDEYLDTFFNVKIPRFLNIYDQIRLIEKISSVLAFEQYDQIVSQLYKLGTLSQDKSIEPMVIYNIGQLLKSHKLTNKATNNIFTTINNISIKNYSLIHSIIIFGCNFTPEEPSKDFIKQIQLLFDSLKDNNVLEIKQNQIIGIFINNYCQWLTNGINQLYQSSRLYNLIKNSPSIINKIYLWFDCAYDQPNIIEQLGLIEWIDQKPCTLDLKQRKNHILTCVFPPDFTLGDQIYSLGLVDKHISSSFLMKKSSEPLLIKYICLDNYTDVSIVSAMRILLNKIILPKESQDIIKILEIFSDHWKNCNGYLNTDPLIFQLICSILMLNTDLSNPNVIKKNTRKKFIHNWYVNIDRTKTINKQVLDMIFTEISSNPFKFTM
jgi:hypothetical protein